jgi:hypothetical protein
VTRCDKTHTRQVHGVEVVSIGHDREDLLLNGRWAWLEAHRGLRHGSGFRRLDETEDETDAYLNAIKNLLVENVEASVDAVAHKDLEIDEVKM